MLPIRMKAKLNLNSAGENILTQMTIASFYIE